MIKKLLIWMCIFLLNIFFVAAQGLETFASGKVLPFFILIAVLFFALKQVFKQAMKK